MAELAIGGGALAEALRIRYEAEEFGGLAQLDRASVSGAESQRFKSSSLRQLIRNQPLDGAFSFESSERSE